MLTTLIQSYPLASACILVAAIVGLAIYVTCFGE